MLHRILETNGKQLLVIDAPVGITHVYLDGTNLQFRRKSKLLDEFNLSKIFNRLPTLKLLGLPMQIKEVMLFDLDLFPVVMEGNFPMFVVGDTHHVHLTNALLSVLDDNKIEKFIPNPYIIAINNDDK